MSEISDNPSSRGTPLKRVDYEKIGLAAYPYYGKKGTAGKVAANYLGRLREKVRLTGDFGDADFIVQKNARAQGLNVLFVAHQALRDNAPSIAYWDSDSYVTTEWQSIEDLEAPEKHNITITPVRIIFHDSSCLKLGNDGIRLDDESLLPPSDVRKDSIARMRANSPKNSEALKL